MQQSKDVTVAAVMTAPRYEAVYARNQIERAMHDAGIPLSISGGVFYGQLMQQMLEAKVRQGVDYIVTVDFDSIFTAKQVLRLVSIVAQEHEIDALAAIQPMRGTSRLLGTTGKNEVLHWNGYPLKFRSAHFGLTVLDAKKLATVPKPWFHHQPDKDGRWTKDKIDDDVWFWRQWESAGNSVYIDPGCKLGHLEEVVTIYDDELNVNHLTTKRWEELQRNENQNGDQANEDLEGIPAGLCV